MALPTLIYFAARGRAELIRLVCAEAGVEYAEHPVGQGTPPKDGRPTDFAALKASGELPFEQVPVWEEPDGFRVAQSLAVARYLAREHRLAGTTSREQALVDQALGGFDDFRAELRKVVTAAPADRAAAREELTTKIAPRWLGYYEKLLRANRGGAGFLVGDAVTVADLALWYLCELCVQNGLGAVEQRPLLNAYFGRIGALPRLAAYAASPQRHAFAPLPK
jgi:glutathione S-transferase